MKTSALSSGNAAGGPDRVVVFMDYQNMHGWARRQFQPVNAHPAAGHVDPLRLARLLVGRRKRPSSLSGVRVYRGRPLPVHQAKAAAANDRQTAEWERSNLVTVVRRPLLYPCDWPTTPASEKGIDVTLALDLVTMGLDGGYDAAILFSSDTDLLPAIETVVQRKLGHVEIASWTGANRIRFASSQLPWCHYVSEAEYRSIEDTTNYASP
ncbi:NYN domain-containing protein [Actinomycetospora sp. C-140]